ncbi:glycosyltransferase family 2 protein [Patescibacteria group bacterium]|nr:glycosyltransferase family 2 protein [Patescibacteria group bacterium]
MVVPAYNEEKMVGEVVKGLNEFNYEVVVVDDGSKDNTSQIAKNAGAVVLRHFINRGQGAALQTGFDYAKKVGADIVVTFDADGQNKPEEVAKIIEPLLIGQIDVALGSRFMERKSNVPLIKKIVLRGGILFERLFVGVKLSDAHNGFRAFSKKAINLIELNQDKMAHATEVIQEIKKHKLKFQEVPVTMRYTEYSKQKGQSVFNSIKIVSDLFLSKVISKK